LYDARPGIFSEAISAIISFRKQVCNEPNCDHFVRCGNVEVAAVSMHGLAAKHNVFSLNVI